jgi:hypothetical protein
MKTKKHQYYLSLEPIDVNENEITDYIEDLEI